MIYEPIGPEITMAVCDISMSILIDSDLIDLIENLRQSIKIRFKCLLHNYNYVRMILHTCRKRIDVKQTALIQIKSIKK